MENFLNILSSKIPPNPPPKPHNAIIAKADSGASQHYFRAQDANALQHKIPTKGPTVYLPDMSQISAHSKGELPLKAISSSAKTAHVFKDLKTSSLISLGQLCDDDCSILLNKHSLHVFKNLQHILHGVRNQKDGLWDITIPPTIPTQVPLFANVNLQKKNYTTGSRHLFAWCMFFAGKKHLLESNKNGNFITWPGLTYSTVAKYLPSTVATAFGHLQQERQNLQSTKAVATDLNYFPPPDIPNKKTNEMFIQLNPFQQTDKAYGDLTGRFPYMSSRGNQYFLVVYDYDSNAILVELLKSRNGTDIKTAYMKIYDKLAQRGCAPKVFILDNEVSTELTSAFTKKKIQYQLVPPDVHRRNAAERAIQTWKHHFIAGISTVDPTFPMAEWDRLVKQGELTLNLLRNSRVNPKLSSWAYIFGNFDYNSTPLAPPGTKVVVHQKPQVRASWDPHGIVGYYTGPAMHHYRCYTCFIPKTRAERITDTVTYIPANIPIPQFTAQDHLQQALDNILNIIKNPPKNMPFLTSGDNTTNALRIIAEILNRNTSQQSSSMEKWILSWWKKFRHTTRKKLFRHHKLRTYTVRHHRGWPT